MQSDCEENVTSDSDSDSTTSPDSAAANILSCAHLEYEDPLVQNEEVVIDESMFQPLYQGANITICGTYCAIMEYKRACKLPFTAIEKLLELLELICPANNGLPKSLYILKSFFKKRSCQVSKQKFCPDCCCEIASDKETCRNSSCHSKDVNYLYTLRPEGQIRKIVTRKYVIVIIHHY